MPPAYIKPYVKRGKNDAVDAAAVCEAMSRPGMRFVPIKSADQQAVLMLHKTRELLIKQRTMSVNALRGHLAELGLIAPRASAASGSCSNWPTATELCRKRPRWRSCSLPSRRARSLDRRREKRIAAANPEKPDGSVARSGSRRRPADRLGDRRQRSRPRRVQVGTRLRGTAGADAKAELERRQGEAWLHHQAGQSIHSQDARRRLHLGAARRRQTQRRSRRLDRGVASESRSAWSRWRSPTSWRNLLGDHDHRRGLPPGDVRQSVERKAIGRATAL